MREIQSLIVCRQYILKELRLLLARRLFSERWVDAARRILLNGSLHVGVRLERRAALSTRFFAQVHHLRMVLFVEIVKAILVRPQPVLRHLLV